MKSRCLFELKGSFLGDRQGGTSAYDIQGSGLRQRIMSRTPVGVLGFSQSLGKTINRVDHQSIICPKCNEGGGSRNAGDEGLGCSGTFLRPGMERQAEIGAAGESGVFLIGERDRENACAPGVRLEGQNVG